MLLLFVLVSPSISPSDRLITINKGQVGVLACEASGTPKPTISWIQDGRTVIRNDSHYKIYNNGTLIINDVNVSNILLFYRYNIDINS